MRHPLASVIFVTIVAMPTSAPARERAKVSLLYQRNSAVAKCPDEAMFRGLVAARLGYDPFVGDGTLALTVELKPEGSEIVGTLRLVGERNERRGNRTMRSGGSDCLELCTSLALVAAVAIDPEAVRTHAQGPPAPPPAPTPAPPPVPAPPPAQPKAQPPPPSPPKEIRADRGLRLEVGAVAPVGMVPSMHGGLRLGAAFEVRWASIGGEGAVFFPSSQSSPAGEVTAYVVHGSLVPCVHPSVTPAVFVDVCAVGSLGAMPSTASRVTRPQPSTDLYAAVGPRAGVTVMPWPAFGFSASADVPVMLSRVHLAIEDRGRREVVWSAERVGLVAGVSAVFRLR